MPLVIFGRGLQLVCPVYLPMLAHCRELIEGGATQMIEPWEGLDLCVRLQMFSSWQMGIWKLFNWCKLWREAQRCGKSRVVI